METTAETAQRVLGIVQQLKDANDVTGAAADALSSLLQSSDPSPALRVISEWVDFTALSCQTLAPGFVIAAPALVFVGAILEHVSKAVENKALVAELGKRASALLPVLKASARLDVMKGEHAATLAALTSTLKGAADAVERVTKHGWLASLWHASGDRAAIVAAEASIDQWLPVLNAALSLAQGVDVKAANAAAVAAARASLEARMQSEFADIRALLLQALERERLQVRRGRAVRGHTVLATSLSSALCNAQFVTTKADLTAMKAGSRIHADAIELKQLRFEAGSAPGGRLVLGKGSYGEVIAAEWHHGDVMPVAVKRFYTDGKALQDRLKREMIDEVGWILRVICAVSRRALAFADL
jgi:hypothetical protein